MDVRERLSKNLQNLRRERNLSQEDLAHRAEIHQTYLSGVESGKRNPSILVLDRIAQALNVDISDLFTKPYILSSPAKPVPVLRLPPLPAPFSGSATKPGR